MPVVLFAYALYVPISIAITVWVGRTLYRNGYRFLVDVFGGDEEMAHSVNHLLVVGFYLMNLGYVALNLRVEGEYYTTRAGVEVLAGKLGGVLLGVGLMHFFNLYVFSRIRARHVAPPIPPVRPDARTRVNEARPAAA
ncbi:MAG: hypothetical protein HOQ11_14685 [Gemmatimonadaceae bacterium]|nr:hypothetical protein [Gemmatimonadaceae bacterium]NUQ93558.1 hypothetical protein [Gemmatimonadaceae bacterium]NUR18575.1 hypothetical protein [Gemmatimonadaceae bacterium]NUS98647.1 hypothetical protein [Gemmatimonadaceae bacterium]